MSFVAITHLWLHTSCCWNVAGHKAFIRLWKVLSDLLIHLVRNCYSDFKVAFFILHPFLYNLKICMPALVGCIVQIKLAYKQILQVCISCRVALWTNVGDNNPYSVSSRIFSRSTKRSLWRNTILMSINGLIFGDGNSTTSKYQLLLVRSQYQLWFISGKNWSITHSLQELQLFLLASWKKKVFFQVVNLEAVHVSKHIGFGAPLLAVE